MDKVQILEKHLKSMLKRTKQSYVTIEQMRDTPEYEAILNALTEIETDIVKNNAVLHGVSGCSLEVIEKLADCNISQNHTGKWGVIFGTFSRTYNFMHKEKKEVLEWIKQNCS